MESWKLVKILIVSGEIALFLTGRCENGLKLKLQAQGLRSYLHVWRSKRYTIWGLEFILYFIFSRPCHLILNTRLPNNTKVTDSSMEWLQPSLFVFIERQGKERQMLRSCNWCPWLSGLGGCVTCKHCAAPLCEILNEWVASNRILVFAHRFLGSPRGKHCNSLEGIVWRKVVPMSKKDFRERLSLFRRSFIRNGLRLCWYKGRISFC